ncbi:uncharacterized histidine-rich protein DDB_G0274557-like [Macrobrachium nipponense]|uniref:uncharacterized histidine-rich protein DDB_G0274557-like n=1 Tax=Macrobrachium nipponense TaxID=159736 RepID=UPI0030C83055
MQFLVLALLVAFACASEIEKREAEPSYGGYGHLSYHHRPSYGHGYSHHYHKRSVDPEPGHFYGYHPVSYGYSHHYHKRSADPEPKAEPSYGRGHYYAYHPATHTYSHHYY